MATVDFGGVRQSVSLACLPEARLGDLVLVHVGLAICRVEESLMELTLEPIPESIPELMAPRLQEPMEAPTEAATRRSAAAPPDPVRQPSPDSTALPAWAHRPEAEA
jgi:hydrogenase maturation factor